jgi:GGDEF domain-containing protein
MQLAALARPSQENAAIGRSLELASQLRAAVVAGDDARIARLLSDLLRVKGLTKGQRVRVQLGALSNLVHSLRAVALGDELTGLSNRRGFMQSGTRLLDLAARDQQAVYLIYFAIDAQSAPTQTSWDVLMRQMGNFLRDLFPSYGVYEVLSRLSATEFAALTPDASYAARAVMPPVPLRIGITQFEPARPRSLDELLQSAAQTAHTPRAQTDSPLASSSRFAPRPGMTLC